MRCYPTTLCEYGLRACVSEQMPNRPRARRRGAWSLVSSPQLGGPAPRRTRGSRDLKTRRADGDARGTPRRSRTRWGIIAFRVVCVDGHVCLSCKL